MSPAGHGVRGRPAPAAAPPRPPVRVASDLPLAGPSGAGAGVVAQLVGGVRGGGGGGAARRKGSREAEELRRSTAGAAAKLRVPVLQLGKTSQCRGGRNPSRRTAPPRAPRRPRGPSKRRPSEARRWPAGIRVRPRLGCSAGPMLHHRAERRYISGASDGGPGALRLAPLKSRRRWGPLPHCARGVAWAVSESWRGFARSPRAAAPAESGLAGARGRGWLVAAAARVRVGGAGAGGVAYGGHAGHVPPHLPPARGRVLRAGAPGGRERQTDRQTDGDREREREREERGGERGRQRERVCVCEKESERDRERERERQRERQREREREKQRERERDSRKDDGGA